MEYSASMILWLYGNLMGYGYLIDFVGEFLVHRQSQNDLWICKAKMTKYILILSRYTILCILMSVPKIELTTCILTDTLLALRLLFPYRGNICTILSRRCELNIFRMRFYYGKWFMCIVYCTQTLYFHRIMDDTQTKYVKQWIGSRHWFKSIP